MALTVIHISATSQNSFIKAATETMKNCLTITFAIWDLELMLISNHKCFFLVFQSLGSMVAFQAMVSIATVGLYIAYALPILFRVTVARISFTSGPFNLGRCSILIGWISVIWVAFITVLFSLPVAYPASWNTFNYTPVAVGGLLLLVLSSWLLSARHWFNGLLSQIVSIIFELYVFINIFFIYWSM